MLAVPALKKRIRWEIRKGLHYLSLVYGAATIICHAPAMNVAWVMGLFAVGAVYVADYFIGFYTRVYLIRNS